MRRRTELALITGGTLAVVTAGALASGVLNNPVEMISGRLRGRGSAGPTPSGEAFQFSLCAPGGPRAPVQRAVGRTSTRYRSIMQAGMYPLVAGMLDPQPGDDLLDIGCGPGAFLANEGQRAGRVAGPDASPVIGSGATPRRPRPPAFDRGQPACSGTPISTDAISGDSAGLRQLTIRSAPSV